MRKPLEGIRVLELTTLVAAPCCGRLLADLGADVIKVERPDGDAWRETGKSYNDKFSDDANPVFDIYNSGKRFVSLDLKTEKGKEVFHGLLSQSDVFITNTRPQALKRLGLAYEDVREKYPRLIYAIVLGYGEKGPDAAKPAFDTTAFWSRSGFLRDQSLLTDTYMPVTPPSSAGDTVTGILLMGEICAALFNRTVTGKGDCVRSGLYHNGIFTLGTMEIAAQKPFGRTYPTNRLDAGVPGGLYQCGDGEWIFIAVGYALAYLPRMYEMIGRPELANDPRFATQATRNENREVLYGMFRDAFLTQTAQYWVDLAGELDLPLVKLNHYADISTDEQAWANGYLEHMHFRSGLDGIMPRSPLSMDSVGTLTTHCAPLIGADNDAVLSELGYTAQQIEEMKNTGAVGK